MLDLLTWCPRRVKLIRNADRHCFTHLRMLGGDGLTALDHAFEPHTEWRTSDGKDGRSVGEVYQRKHLMRMLPLVEIGSGALSVIGSCGEEYAFAE